MRGVVLVMLVLVAVAACASTLIGVEEAMSLAFPGVTLTRETLFLTDEQVRRAEESAGTELASAMVTRFSASSGGGVVGWGYLDTHRVRTLPETVLIMIDSKGQVVRVEVVAFREPLEYLPPEGWYRQFDGESLSDNLALKRSIRPITGATLTARSTTDAVRRALAIHDAVAADGGLR
jgi:hypothetical protein